MDIIETSTQRRAPLVESARILSENDESTVLAHFERDAESVRDDAFQSEAELERAFIKQLETQGYEYVKIHGEAQLEINLRAQLEGLNQMKFTDKEWDSFFRSELANGNQGIADKSETIQRDTIKPLIREDGSVRNIKLLERTNLHDNRMQVINQYVPEGGTRANRYDVTVLINGLPMVHIELKRRGKSIREAFNQIDRYGRESFWSGHALFEYVQLFVISNGTQTKYYSNTTREGQVTEQAPSNKKMNRAKTSNSFEFTSYWADAENRVINDLTDFAATFFNKNTLLNIISRFCVLTEQKMLMAMRPYQIAAAERVLKQIEINHKTQRWGSVESGGYVWHTTGSGKTLTSFKTAQLAVALEYIKKVLFVVDRKDLDYQTIREYDRFEKGAANGNTSTKMLEAQLANPKCRIIITTIQKLTNFVNRAREHGIFNEEVVMIFDECHRSQFGEMHRAITKKFKKYYLFGFTGTPIFNENKGNSGILRTTEDIFGRRLHTYTIVDAIRDHNVLPFRVSYINTIKAKADIENAQVYDIERDEALKDPQRIRKISEYILANFDKQTARSQSYKIDGRRVSGFNSILAVQSIEYAKLYYNAIKALQEDRPVPLKVATIFSYAPNEAESDWESDENNDNAELLDRSSRDFLERAISDYNAMFKTNYNTGEGFHGYYQDVSMRMKNRELDMLIVVNMFLTGFDATTLNTLWVDKNLRYHGLIQSYSRTNRILNAVKVMGNIVCFRNLENATNKALSLFGDKDARGTSIIRPFKDYYHGYTDEKGHEVRGYKELVEEFKGMYSTNEMPLGDKAKREFVIRFGQILKLYNLLSFFEEFDKNIPLSERERQDYSSIYLSIKEEMQHGGKKERVNDDLEFEVELIKQVEVNIDFILFLVAQYYKDHQKNPEIKGDIARAIDASPNLRDKKELIMVFVDSLSGTYNKDVYEEWRRYVNEQKRAEYQQIIDDEKLNQDEAIRFITNSFSCGYVQEGGLGIGKMIPKRNPFDKSDDREGLIHRVLDKIKAFFNKFYEIANGEF